MRFKKIGALLLSAVLCIGMAAPAFAYGDMFPFPVGWNDKIPAIPQVGFVFADDTRKFGYSLRQ